MNNRPGCSVCGSPYDLDEDPCGDLWLRCECFDGPFSMQSDDEFWRLWNGLSEDARAEMGGHS